MTYVPIHGTYADLTIVFRQLCRLNATLPFAALEAGEAQRLGGQIFLEGAEFVGCVARCLRGNESLFPRITETADALEAEEGCAQGWLKVRDALALMTRLANDTYLKVLAGAIGRARAVLEEVARSDAEDTARTGMMSRKALLFGVAFYMVEGHHRMQVEQKAKLKAAREAQKPKAPPSPRSVAAKERAKKQAAEGAWRGFERVFIQVLKSSASASTSTSTATATATAMATPGPGVPERVGFAPPPGGAWERYRPEHPGTMTQALMRAAMRGGPRMIT